MHNALAQVAPHLPPALFGAETLGPMARVAESLPPGLSTFWGFECRLGESAARSDILFQIKRDGPGVTLLAGQAPSALDALSSQPVWRALRDFAAEWNEPGHELHRLVRNLWLEFDTAEVTDSADLDHVIHQPNIFIGPDASATQAEVLRLMEAFCRRHGRILAALDALPAFLDALPDGAMVFQLGLMLTRPEEQGLRLCVNEVPIGQVTPWLERLMDVPVARSIAAEVEAMARRTQDLAFGFNLTPAGVEPAVGLECYQSWEQEDPPQWSALLDDFLKQGLCLAEKRDGVLAYSGKAPVPKEERKVEGRLHTETHRRIHHVKLALTGAGIIQAKAYLAVSRPALFMGEALGQNFSGLAPQRNAWTLE